MQILWAYCVYTYTYINNIYRHTDTSVPHPLISGKFDRMAPPTMKIVFGLLTLVTLGMILGNLSSLY